MPALIILAALLLIPVLEIAVFIVIGSQIGVGLTLALILLTAVIGTVLLRQQGLSTIRQIQSATQANQLPATALLHGLMIAVAGVLLLTPGFVTDTIGFLLFVPPLRLALIAVVKSRLSVQVKPPPSSGGEAPTVELDPSEFHATDSSDSPWTDGSHKR